MGQPVDWWVQYKTPGNCKGGPWQRGNVTLYMDAIMAGRQSRGGGTPAWRLESLDRYDGALQRTLAQLTAEGTGQALYNDQPPYYRYKYTTYLPWAHAKGLLHFNHTAAIWLRHSIPVWPNRTSSPYWGFVPLPETCLGQHLLCLSLSASTLDGPVAALLSKFKPYFYQITVPVELASTYPVLSQVLAAASDPSAAPGAPSSITFDTLDVGSSGSSASRSGSSGGDSRSRSNGSSNSSRDGDCGSGSGGSASWTAFAKANRGSPAEAWIYEDLVVPGLQASMALQTWRTLFGAFGPDSCRYDPRQSMNASCGIAPGDWDSVNVAELAVPAGLPAEVAVSAGSAAGVAVSAGLPAGVAVPVGSAAGVAVPVGSAAEVAVPAGLTAGMLLSLLNPAQALVAAAIGWWRGTVQWWRGSSDPPPHLPPVSAWRSCDDHSKWGLALPLPEHSGSTESSKQSSGGSSSNDGKYSSSGGISGSSSGPFGGLKVPKAPWVCFCDNNREWSQERRGGACTCTESQPLWRAMAAVVRSAPDTCGRPDVSGSGAVVGSSAATTFRMGGARFGVWCWVVLGGLLPAVAALL